MTTVKEVYKDWLGAKQSLATRKKYQSSVTLFCKMMFNKAADDIDEKDLAGLRYAGSNGVYGNFIKPLRKKGNKDSTIQSHYTAVMSYFNALSRDGAIYKVNIDNIKKNALSSIDLSTKDGGHYENITKEEVENLKEWLCNRNYKIDPDGLLGERYAMLTDFMFKTAVRATATFDITWSNFKITPSPYGGMWAKLEVIDKGRKLNVKWIPYEYYNKLRELFYNGNNQECVFSKLNKNTFTKLLSNFSEEKLDRTVAPHSLKIGAVSELYAKTKDMMLCKEFADHEDVSVTQRYIRLNPNPNRSGTAIMMQEREYSDLDNLSKKELLALIHKSADSENLIFTAAKEAGLI